MHLTPEIHSHDIDMPKATWWRRICNLPVMHSIVKFCRKLHRAGAYAKFGWSTHEWDHHEFIRLLNFKCKRMLTEFTENNFGTDPSGLREKSLKVCLRILKRLLSEDELHSSYMAAYNAHTRKYGLAETEFIPCEDNPNLSTMETTWSAVPEDQQEEAHDSLRAAFAADAAIRDRDAKWLFNIINKYYTYWWD
jgi:hypothetical protein